VPPFAVPAEPEAAVRDLSAPDIERALRQDELLPYFQPKVSVSQRRLVGVEASLRWQSPDLGLMSATQVLPRLFDLGFIEAATAIIVARSLTHCQDWLRAGLDIRLSINLPTELLCDARVVDRIESQARARGLEPGRIIIEIPELAFAAVRSDTLDRLVNVRVRGFGLAVDDFGSTRCSREQLERIPASELKVDRSLLAQAVANAAQRQRLERALSIARDLNLDAVVEGVETQAEWDFATDLAFDFAQGNFVAAPMPGDALKAWHARHFHA